MIPTMINNSFNTTSQIGLHLTDKVELVSTPFPLADAGVALDQDEIQIDVRRMN